MARSEAGGDTERSITQAERHDHPAARGGAREEKGPARPLRIEPGYGGQGRFAGGRGPAASDQYSDLFLIVSHMYLMACKIVVETSYLYFKPRFPLISDQILAKITICHYLLERTGTFAGRSSALLSSGSRLTRVACASYTGFCPGRARKARLQMFCNIVVGVWDPPWKRQRKTRSPPPPPRTGGTVTHAPGEMSDPIDPTIDDELYFMDFHPQEDKDSRA